MENCCQAGLVGCLESRSGRGCISKSNSHVLSVNTFTCFYLVDGISMVASLNLNDFIFPANYNYLILLYNSLVVLTSFTQAVV